MINSDGESLARLNDLATYVGVSESMLHWVSFHSREVFGRGWACRGSWARCVGSMSLVSKLLRIWKRKMADLVVEVMYPPRVLALGWL